SISEIPAESDPAQALDIQISCLNQAENVQAIMTLTGKYECWPEYLERELGVTCMPTNAAVVAPLTSATATAPERVTVDCPPVRELYDPRKPWVDTSGRQWNWFKDCRTRVVHVYADGVCRGSGE